MRRFAKYTAIVLAAVVVLAGGVAAYFYKPNLTRDELRADYTTAASQFVNLPNGASVHYRDEGPRDAPVIVLVHGGFGSLQNWEGWVEELQGSYRLISMDLLGHGLTGGYPAKVYTRLTERDMIQQLLAHLGVERYTVAGNSFGGGIALELALANPQAVEGLILVAAEGVPNSEDGYDASLFSDSGAVLPTDPGYTRLSTLERLGKNFIGPTVVRSTLETMYANDDLLTDDVVNRFATVLRHEGNREAQLLMFPQGMDMISRNDKQDLRPRLAELAMPTLVIAGEEDTLVPMRVNTIYAEEIPDATLVAVPNAGHMPMIEKPTETATAVREFMARVSSASTTE